MFMCLTQQQEIFDKKDETKRLVSSNRDYSDIKHMMDISKHLRENWRSTNTGSSRVGAELWRRTL